MSNNDLYEVDNEADSQEIPPKPTFWKGKGIWIFVILMVILVVVARILEWVFGIVIGLVGLNIFACKFFMSRGSTDLDNKQAQMRVISIPKSRKK